MLNEERVILKKYGEKFQKWLDSETGKKEMQDHRDYSNYFKSNLSSQNIPKMAKSDLVELYKNFWTSHVWKNKDWNINQIIEKNGLDNLKNQNINYFMELNHLKKDMILSENKSRDLEFLQFQKS